MTVKGRPLMTAGRRTYSGGVIDVVINEKEEPYLNRGGEVVGETGGGGPTPWTVSLIQIVRPVRSVSALTRGQD